MTVAGGLGGRWRARCVVLGLVLAVVLCLPHARPALAHETQPFRARNLNPLLAVFGLPVWEVPPREGRRQTGMSLELANHYRFSRRGTDALMLDAETWRGSVYHQERFAERWWLSVDLPYYRLHGGALDRLIENWHSAFGLPDGSREERERNQVLVRLEDAEGPFFGLERAVSGVGDVQLGAGRAIGPEGGLLLRVSVTLPTGKESMLAGNGGGDWSLTLLRPRRGTFRERAAGFYYGVGLLRSREPALVRFESRRWAHVAVVGGAWQVLPRFGIKAQLDLHGALYRSRLREIGRTTVHGTLGGWWSLGERMVVEYGVSEDLVVGASPDIVLHAGVRVGL